MVVMVIIIIIILYVQLPATMTIETPSKMSNTMRPLTFFDDMIDPRVGEQNHPLFPFA